MGDRLMELCRELYPLHRSLTGEGVRATLRRLARIAPIEIQSLPSGWPILDWTVPREWHVEEAYIRSPHGERIADVQTHTLHLVGYSAPFEGTVDRTELDRHLHSLPEHPDWIPYRTSYWRETWGFCVPHRVRASLPEGRYQVVVRTRLDPSGVMNWGELVLPGRSAHEILITTHICHPSMANDNCSGMAVAAYLAAEWARRADTQHTVRFLFLPGTVGAIAWLALHRAVVPRIRHVLVITGLGDPGPLTLKHSRTGDREVDRVPRRIAAQLALALQTRPFSPYGYDERQFASPGFALPTIVLSRTPFGEYPEYHTSADNLDFIRADALNESYQFVLRVLTALDATRHPVNVMPFGEPQLGRRGLYEAIGGHSHTREDQLAMLWVLNQADGDHSVDDIVEQSGLPRERIERALAALEQQGLIRWLEASP